MIILPSVRHCGSTHTNVNLVIMRNFKHPLMVFLTMADYERLTGIKHGPEHSAVVEHFYGGRGHVITVGFAEPSAELLLEAMSNLRKDEVYKIRYWGDIAQETIAQINQLDCVQHVLEL